MKNKHALLLLLCSTLFANAQVYNGDLVLIRQTQVDSFNYTEINGNLTIRKANNNPGYSFNDITNLAGLITLTKVNGRLSIGSYLDSLKNLQGLNNLREAQEIHYSSLTNYLTFNGLDNLEKLKRFFVYSNGTVSPFVGLSSKLKNVDDIELNVPYLLDLEGLQNITRVKNLTVNGFYGLKSLHGLEGLKTISGQMDIMITDSLSNFSGLQNLDSVGRFKIGLWYLSNHKTLEGFNNLKYIGYLLSNGMSGISFQGLNNIERIDTIYNTDSYFANSFTSFNGLQSLKSIGVFEYLINMYDMPDSFNFEGLNNVETIHDFLPPQKVFNSKGLNNLKSITGKLTFSSSQIQKFDFSYLQNLNYINNFVIDNSNSNYVSFNGLQNLTRIDTLYLDNASWNLNSSYLKNLTEIKKLKIANTRLDSTGLDFMSNIRTIKDLEIRNCNVTNLNGLRNLDLVSGNLNVSNNYNLHDCCGIKYLLLNGGVRGNIFINNNQSNDFNIPYEQWFECNNIDSIYTAYCDVTRDSINLVEAKLFIDNNNNSIYDANDIPVGNKNINATYPNGTTISNITNNSGKAKFYTLRGTFPFKTVSTIPNYTVTPVTVSKTFTTLSNSDSVQFIAKPTSVFSDASVQTVIGGISRSARQNSLLIHLSNDGTTPINGQLKFKIDDRATILSTSPLFNSTIGDTLVWNITNLSQLAQQNIYVQYMPDSFGLAPFDTLYHYATFANNTTDATPANNSFVAPDPIRGSYDPNDKSVSNAFITPSMVANGNYLTYTIRFQNTGNDTAFRVEIRDTLSDNLDWNSIEMIGASHNYEFRQENGKYVYFTFNNIMLPDSNVNEAKSHGFISFKIKPKSTLPLGSEIKNTVDIYFDLNAAVRTNTVQTTVQLLSNTNSNPRFDGKLSVFPNPNSGAFNLKLDSRQSGNLVITITNINGQIVYTAKEYHVGNTLLNINSNNWEAGTYLVNIQLNNETTSQKLLIVK